MGVLCDYFRGPDAATVTDLMERHDGDSPATIDEWAVAVVDAKGLDPAVCLDALCSFIVGVEWAGRRAGGRLIWPVLNGEALMEHEGPWVELLDDAVRDALAGVDDDRILELAARWVRIEEIHRSGAPDDELVPVLTELVALARATRAAGDHLYCWMSL
jgi:hypothetical protein